MSWINKIEKPITREDKYLYQIITRLDKIIDLLEGKQQIQFTKPIGTKDEPNEIVTTGMITQEEVNAIEDTCNLDEMTIIELKDLAKELGIKGYSTMRKSELIDTINHLQSR
jgi:CBS domain containing-hemolysin-like protein